MLRKNNNIKEFNNGNINFRFDQEQIAEIKSGKVSDIEVISWILDKIDCYFVGESYCLNNYAMGATIYNAHSDLCYTINFSDIETVLMAGHYLKLHAREPNEYDRESIARFFGN